MYRTWTAFVLCGVFSFLFAATVAEGQSESQTTPFEECILRHRNWGACFIHLPGVTQEASTPSTPLFPGPSILGSKGYRALTPAEILLRHELPGAIRSQRK